MTYTLNIDRHTLEEMAEMTWPKLGPVINGNIYAAALAHGDEIGDDEAGDMMFILFSILCSDLGYGHIPMGQLGSFVFTTDITLREFLAQLPAAK